MPQSLAECRRTARLAESVLVQLEVSDFVQLQCLRAAAVREVTQMPPRSPRRGGGSGSVVVREDGRRSEQRLARGNQ